MIALRQLEFSYGPGAFAMRVDQLDIAGGERIAVVGPSGSGKTTLLSLIAGIRVPQRGTVTVDNQAVSTMGDGARRRFRIERIGFVFQDFELLDYLTVADNILLPYRINRHLRLSGEARRHAAELSGAVGLADKMSRYPQTLSRGERQRIAICRALVTSPAVLLADEPTSSLDRETAAASIEKIFELAEQRDATLVMLTHDPSLLDRFDRVVDTAAFAADAGKRPAGGAPA